jgi:hypothetical protein
LNAYNKEYPNNKIRLNKRYETIRRSKYKKYLINEFKEKLKEKCNDQICWTRQPFINKMNKIYKKKLLNNTFRPEGPGGNIWLDTNNINRVMEQYHEKHPEFIFLGAVPIDFNDLDYLPFKNMDFNNFKNLNKHKLGIIFNLDESYKSGSHWVALYSDIKDGKIYYYDSYGIHPEKRIRDFMNRIYKHCKNNCYNRNIILTHNKIRHQYGGSECGVYSINFILRLLDGDNFHDICNDKTTDEQINRCRKKYFNIVK